MQFRMLGTLAAIRDGRPVELRRRRQRALLALLLVEANRVVSVDRLVFELWGEDVALERALDGVHVTIHALRKALEPDRPARTPPTVLVTRPPGYMLRVEDRDVDARQFAQLAAEGHQALRDGRHAAALNTIDTALALWRGPALADFATEPFAQPEIARLDELHAAASEDRIEALLALGEHATAVPELEVLVGRYPLREQLRSLLALALYRGGRQADALAALAEARHVLASEFGIDFDPRLARLEQDLLQQSPALDWVAPPREPDDTGVQSQPPTAPRIVGNLPHQLTRFVGREPELAQVAALMSEARLITLTGPGGSGKTRIALQAAAGAGEMFPDGVWLVMLAQLSDGALLTQTVAEAVGVAEKPGESIEAVLTEHLRDRTLLLIMDSCEHLLDSCTQLVWSLLANSRNLHVLATSREALGIQGERTLDVPPLDLPESDDPIAVDGSDAVRLFVDRAQDAVAAFRLTPKTVPTVAHICRRLDGIPLALELAAARLRTLSLDQIAARLDDRFRLLTGGSRIAVPRHNTLQAAMDWSYDLLEDTEQALFTRLSVFAGGFDVEAAEAVAEGAVAAQEVVDVLGRLVDKSLVVLRRNETEGRYELLETIRQYGSQRLVEREDAHAARERHAAFYLALAESAEQRLQGVEQRLWLERLEAEHDNVRAALAFYSLDDDHVARLRIGTALWRYSYLRAHYQEGREWLEEGLRAAADPPPHLSARALTGAGALAFYQCDYSDAQALCDAALSLYREVEDHRGTGVVLTFLGSIARERGDYETALACYGDSRAVFESLDDHWGAGNALQLSGFVSWLRADHENALLLSTEALRIFRGLGDDERAAWAQLDLGAVAHYCGDLDRSAELLADSLAQFGRVQFKEGVAWALNLLGLDAHRRGDLDDAEGLLERSLQTHRELGDRWRASSVMDALGAVACDRGDRGRAAALMGAAAALRELIGTPVPPVEQPLRQKTLEILGLDERGHAAPSDAERTAPLLHGPPDKAV